MVYKEKEGNGFSDVHLLTEFIHKRDESLSISLIKIAKVSFKNLFQYDVLFVDLLHLLLINFSVFINSKLLYFKE